MGWNIETHGAEPDIEVEITPQDYCAGRNPQVARAMSEIFRLLQWS